MGAEGGRAFPSFCEWPMRPGLLRRDVAGLGAAAPWASAPLVHKALGSVPSTTGKNMSLKVHVLETRCGRTSHGGWRTKALHSWTLGLTGQGGSGQSPPGRVCYKSQLAMAGGLVLLQCGGSPQRQDSPLQVLGPAPGPSNCPSHELNAPLVLNAHRCVQSPRQNTKTRCP